MKENQDANVECGCEAERVVARLLGQEGAYKLALLDQLFHLHLENRAISPKEMQISIFQLEAKIMVCSSTSFNICFEIEN